MACELGQLELYAKLEKDSMLDERITYQELPDV